MTNIGKQVSVTLSRGLGLFDVTMIGVGAMIGAGIFGLTGIAAGKAGPIGLLVAFLLNGIVTSLTSPGRGRSVRSAQQLSDIV